MMFGLLRQASSLLGISQDGEEETKTTLKKTNVTEEGEVIFCKNNVCVHPPVPLRSEPEHRPGYLTIRLQNEVGTDATLVLTWIPNSSLKKNSRSIENRTSASQSPCRSSRSSAYPSPRRSPRHSLPSIYLGDTSPDFIYDYGQTLEEIPSFTKPSRSSNPLEAECMRIRRRYSSMSSTNSSIIGPEEVSEALEAMISGLNDVEFEKEIKTNDETKNETKEKRKDEILEAKSMERTRSASCSMIRKTDLKLVLYREPNGNDTSLSVTPNISITSCHRENAKSEASSLNESITSNCDLESPSERETNSRDVDYNDQYSSSSLGSYYMEGTPESLAAVHKLHFPEQNVAIQPETPSLSPSRRSRQPCSLFSVDLAQMKSLRLFFSNKECTCGQLVIASRESQYKILHFHHGGLNKLAKEFEKWDIFIKPKAKSDNVPYRQFSISRPQVTKEECHPEEGLYEVVDEEAWMSYFNDDGQIEEDFHLRKAIFFGGLDTSIRRDAWPFLLHYYPFLSTWDERELIRTERYLEYASIRKKREMMNEIEREIFWRNIQCTVEKDVVRTDRSNPFFVGDNNPNLELMRNILLNYAIYNPTMGYTQGMSDLLAPILTEVQNESDSFWCFVGLMQRTIFISSPRDNDMDKHLNFIRELIRLMVPKFHGHLQDHCDAMELLFCHRWILLCFKREFPDSDALRMWESCWAHYQTDYFHLFLCVAIIAIYGEDVIEQNMNPDEMLLYFSSLSLHMNGDLVLRKARGLLHQFRQRPSIPCTLQGLCEMCGHGMWDSGHVPVIQCVGHDGTNASSCPNGGDIKMP